MAAMFTNESHTSIVSGVTCQGVEENLLQCEHGGLVTHQCELSLTVGVTCQSKF